MSFSFWGTLPSFSGRQKQQSYLGEYFQVVTEHVTEYTYFNRVRQSAPTAQERADIILQCIASCLVDLGSNTLTAKLSPVFLLYNSAICNETSC